MNIKKNLLDTISIEDISLETDFKVSHLKNIFRDACLTKIGKHYLKDEVLAYFTMKSEVMNEPRRNYSSSEQRMRIINQNWRNKLQSIREAS